MDVVAHAALALGMVFVSSCHEDAARAILQALEERSAQLSEPLGRFLALGLALLFLGEQVRPRPLSSQRAWLKGGLGPWQGFREHLLFVTGEDARGSGQPLLPMGRLHVLLAWSQSLAYLGCASLPFQDAVDATVEVAKTLDERISSYCQITLQACAYAGTGNVLKVRGTP